MVVTRGGLKEKSQASSTRKKAAAAPVVATTSSLTTKQPRRKTTTEKPAAAAAASVVVGQDEVTALPAAASSSSASSSPPAKHKSPSKAKSSSPSKGKKKATAAVQKKDFQYEFGGPLGALGIVIGLPLVVLGLYFYCPNYRSTSSTGLATCLKWSDLLILPDLILASLASLQDLDWLALPQLLHSKGQEALDFTLHQLWDTQIFLNVVEWFLFQVLLERLLPGEVALGVPLKDGKRLDYRLNGHLACWISLIVMGHGYPQFDAHSKAPLKLVGFGPFPLDQLYTHYPQYAFAALVFSFILSIYMYLSSFRWGALLAEGGDSGNHIYDFYIGRELNPRIGNFDWKYFCELRPGLIGWVILNLGMLVAHHKSGVGFSLPLVLVTLFQGWYVVDALVHERAILTTMDITTDGFGFMLVFGDLAWVPFTYSLQARYLVGRQSDLGAYAILALTALNCFGYYIFRQANSTKDAFRRDPSSIPQMKYLETTRGTKLMISGWWGWARKINYTGDWLMALSWCLLCGPTHFVPYFYCIYFGILLVHRAFRDDYICAAKYGHDWERYKEAVPCMFLPWIL